MVVSELYQTYATFVFHGSDNWIKLRDSFYVTHGSFALLQNAFYFKMIQETTNKLIDTGIVQQLLEDQLGKKINFKKLEQQPKVLELKDLSFGFNIWIGFCCISIFSFVLEILVMWIYFFIKKYIPRFLGNEIRFASIYPIKNKTENSNIKTKSLACFRIKATRSLLNSESNEIDDQINEIQSL